MKLTFKELKLYPLIDMTPADDRESLLRLFSEYDSLIIPVPGTGDQYTCFCLDRLMQNEFEESEKQCKDSDITIVQQDDPVYSHLSNDTHRCKLFIVYDAQRPVGWIDLKSTLLCATPSLLPRVKDIMIPHQQHLTVENTIYEAHKALFSTNLEHIVVCKNNESIGIITKETIMKLIEEGCDIWGTKTDKHYIKVPNITPDTLLREALHEYLHSNSDVLIVHDEHKLILGTLVRKDLLNYMALDHSTHDETSQGGSSNDSIFLDAFLSSSLKTGILGTDDNLNAVYHNSAFIDFMHDPQELTIGGSILQALKSCNFNEDTVLTMFNKARSQGEQVATSRLAKDNPNRLIQCRVNAVRKDGLPMGFVLALQDITAQRNAEEAIRKLAYYDPLTKLPNRLLFEERLEIEVKKSHRNNTKFAVVMMDLDGFKAVNDQYGHSTGDKLLEEAGKRLTATVRESDTVSRFGGDEFLFIFPEVDSMGVAQKFTRKLAAAIEQPFDINNEPIRVSCSIGISIYPDDTVDKERLLEMADARMYTEKGLQEEWLGLPLHD